MTITAIKKENFKAVKDLLINKYNAYNIENEGNYFYMFIDFEDQTLQCELTRDCAFGSWDAVKLAGNGWSEEEIAKQAAAAKLETEVYADMKKITKEVVAS